MDSIVFELQLVRSVQFDMEMTLLEEFHLGMAKTMTFYLEL